MALVDFNEGLSLILEKEENRIENLTYMNLNYKKETIKHPPNSSLYCLILSLSLSSIN